MLKAVELSGFKSFADRTRLEFADGVSAIVGPNGSGKSNIVDAIKWVLGEQSAKKLRGGDMTDVIFNGSAGRQPLGAAEVTLSFDNSTRIFDLDVPEVHITRRIYRSGEGEYLINRQQSRLKDIKDMLSGTGLGTQAYSIIEQGRVESLLQSSSVQRRTIFEEAAGTSRFNTKKLEAQRKLERADQNLIRIADIVSEIDNQRRTARNQAGKAQLFREYNSRLRELRINDALIEFRQRERGQANIVSEIESSSTSAQNLSEAVDRNEKLLVDCNDAIESLDVEIRRFEGEIAATREKISGEESTIELQSRTIDEIETEIQENVRQLVELNVRSVDTEEMMRKTVDDLGKATKSSTDIAESYQRILEHGEELANAFKSKQEERKALRKELDVQNKQTAKLAASVSGLESRLTTLQTAKEQGAIRLETLFRQKDELQRQTDELQTVVEEHRTKAQRKEELLDTAKRQKTKRAKDLIHQTAELSELKQRQSAMRERISVLEELIRKNEGLSPGVREVLNQSRDPKSPFRFVHGLVADLLRVDVDAAPLIELALGPHAQYVVVSPKAELFKHVEKNAANFAGRVGLIWLDPSENEAAWMKEKGFFGRPGVHGRADQFVKADPSFIHLARRLLGRTWIVDNISVAKALYRESDDRTNFLTLSGELLTSDGALIIGPPHASSGLITRRSELRTLSEQMTAIDLSVAEKEIAVAAAMQRTFEDEHDFETETREHQKAVSEYEAKRLEHSTAVERSVQAGKQYDNLVAELDKLDAQFQRAAGELDRTKIDREELDELIASLEIQIIESQQRADEAEQNHVEHQKKMTNVKIELAKSEERLDFLKERIRQFEEHLKERQEHLAENRRRDQMLKNKRDAALLSILRTESTLASLYLKKESATMVAAEYLGRRADLVTNRVGVQTELKRQQHDLNKLQSKRHARQLELERLLQEQKTLLDRMKDEYEVDLSNEKSLGDLPPDLEASTENHQSEIEELRQKIQKLGNVNHESIEALDELENRYTFYATHFSDLTTAKKNLEKIIERINGDTRRLFEETFEGVRLHFKDLFQQLFGGGQADLILEDPNNVLECGIEIVARPPGKELKSVSLLSGGEKTLTCVALLLAFFRFRPNPVCILDEVDAALDEGNIDRFVRVVKEFRTAPQFLIISHSKKTMAAASTIYGVTMQESGVSKPISVRFVDVGENGEILADKEHKAA